MFSDCAAIGRWASDADLPALVKTRKAFPSPEDINDSPVTAPSRRLKQLVPGYQKTLHGPLIAIETGLDPIRAECPHFNAWLTALEALAGRG